MGAMNVALHFSAASIRMVRSSSTVSAASMNKPRAIEVPSLKLVSTSRGVGNMQDTRAAATMPPNIWAGKSSKPRTHGSVPLIIIPNTTWIHMLASCLLSIHWPTRESYGRVEEATGNAVEGPSCRGQGKSERQTDEQQLVQGELGWRKRICNLRAPKCKEQEERGADELAWHGHHMSSCLGHPRMIRRFLASLVLQVWIEAGQLASPGRMIRRGSWIRTFGATKRVFHSWYGEIGDSNRDPTSSKSKNEDSRAARREVMLRANKAEKKDQQMSYMGSPTRPENSSRGKPASHQKGWISMELFYSTAGKPSPTMSCHGCLSTCPHASRWSAPVVL